MERFSFTGPDDFTYTYSVESDFRISEISIQPNTPKTVPQTLGKFYSINKYSLEALKKSKFYVAEPQRFNDVFDSSYFTLDHSDLPENLLNGLCAVIGSPYEKFLKEYGSEKAMQCVFEMSYRLLLGRFGIFCTSPNVKDELMWGLYTNNRGFYVQFDYRKLPGGFYGPFPVNYLKDFKHISVRDYKNSIEALLVHTNVKKDRWIHEDEWRFLYLKKDGGHFEMNGYFKSEQAPEIGAEKRQVEYDPTIIKAIYLGCYFPDQLYEGSTITFNGDDKYYRSSLLDVIIERNIPCFLMGQNRRTLELEPSPMLKPEKLGRYKYKIE